VPLIMSAVLVSLLVVGTEWCTLLFSGSETAVVPLEGGCCVISGGGSAVLAAVPGAKEGISGAGVGVSGVEGRVPKAGTEVIPLGAECRHLPGEVLYLLLRCSAVGGWFTASGCWLGCDLRDAVCTPHCGVQAAFLLTGEESLYVGGS
jgi:hypothetical protein